MSAPARLPSVAIPTRNGGELFIRTLAVLARQTVAHELIVCDSGSTDGSVECARASGARVVEIEPARFSHGGTRNLLMAQATGARVAFLTQDAEPADERWLERLLAGMDLAEDVGIAYGPYRPRPTATPAVRAELAAWFQSLAPDGRPQIARLTERERSLPAIDLLGRRGFFTDANACVARAAWEAVHFRDVAYAEDRVLAMDMLRAGYAKAFVPAAVVLHSHDYTSVEQLRRCFDEWRGLLEVYGWREPGSPAQLVRSLRGQLSRAREDLTAEGVSPARRPAALVAVARHHVLRSIGALLGSHADRLPAEIRRRLSLEGRAGFDPVLLDGRPPDTTPRQRAPTT